MSKNEGIKRGLAAMERMGEVTKVDRYWLERVPTERLGAVVADLERNAAMYEDEVATVTLESENRDGEARVEQRVAYLPLEGWVPKEPGDYLPLDKSDKPLPERAVVEAEELGY